MLQTLKRHRILIGAIILVLLVVGILGAWRFRSRLRPVYHIVKVLLASREMSRRTDPVDILFVHHSTGHNLIAQGNVRGLFTEAGYDFWDHDYNPIGLTRPDGTAAGYSYNIPGDNTDPDGLARLFSQPVYQWPVNALSAVLQHRVIVFKSCFPVSNISSVEQLDAYKSYYLGIRQVVAQHPDHIFVAMTPPPLTPQATTPENALRAREFANWLKSDEFLSGYSNLHTFDFFDLLAQGDPSAADYSMLRAEYRPPEAGDSHPNKLANEAIGPKFVQFVINAIRS